MSECNSTPWINGIVLISTGLTFLLSGLTVASQTKKQKKEELRALPKTAAIQPRYLKFPKNLDL